MKKALFVLILFNMFTTSLSWAQDNNSLLRIEGKPLAPACLIHFVNNRPDDDVIDLQTDPCLRIQHAYDQSALKRRFWGYHLPDDARLYAGMQIYYRYLGEVNRQSKQTKAVLVLWSGGGTGLFSDIVFLEADKGKLRRVDEIEGGDRCSGGISDADLSHGVLSYHKQVTPMMLMTMHQKRRSYDSLSDCAVCCIGELIYQEDKLIGFKFKRSLAKNRKENKMMRCFNRLAKSYGRHQSRHLSLSKLSEFRQKIKSVCKK